MKKLVEVKIYGSKKITKEQVKEFCDLIRKQIEKIKLYRNKVTYEVSLRYWDITYPKDVKEKKQ